MADEREGLLARRERIAEDVREMVRDVDHWNRVHPDWTPLTVDDKEGSLDRAMQALGLDLATLEAEARRG